MTNNEMLINFGNPYAQDIVPAESEGKEKPDLADAGSNRLSTFIEQEIQERLGEIDENRVRAIETFTVNAFLRHLPSSDRHAYSQRIFENTRGLSRLDPKRYIQGVGAFILYNEKEPDKSKIYIKPEDYNSGWLIHETLHWLQGSKIMPPNSALTMAATYLIINSSKHARERFPSLLAEEMAYPYYLKPENKESYFRQVLSGKTSEMFKDGWVLNPTDEIAHKDFILYLKYENLINHNFKDEFAEEFETPEGVINHPYEVMREIGRARAERAFIVGKLSGNIDHAWTILYLHSTGMPFEQAEQEVVSAIMQGKTAKFYETYEKQVQRKDTIEARKALVMLGAPKPEIVPAGFEASRKGFGCDIKAEGLYQVEIDPRLFKTLSTACGLDETQLQNLEIVLRSAHLFDVDSFNETLGGVTHRSTRSFDKIQIETYFSLPVRVSKDEGSESVRRVHLPLSEATVASYLAHEFYHYVQITKGLYEAGNMGSCLAPASEYDNLSYEREANDFAKGVAPIMLSYIKLSTLPLSHGMYTPQEEYFGSIPAYASKSLPVVIAYETDDPRAYLPQRIERIGTPKDLERTILAVHQALKSNKISIQEAWYLNKMIDQKIVEMRGQLEDEN